MGGARCKSPWHQARCPRQDNPAQPVPSTVRSAPTAFGVCANQVDSSTQPAGTGLAHTEAVLRQSHLSNAWEPPSARLPTLHRVSLQGVGLRSCAGRRYSLRILGKLSTSDRCIANDVLILSKVAGHCSVPGIAFAVSADLRLTYRASWPPLEPGTDRVLLITYKIPSRSCLNRRQRYRYFFDFIDVLLGFSRGAACEMFAITCWHRPGPG